MLLDVDKFHNLLQESYFNFRGKDYIFFPDEKTEFYSLSYYKRKIQSFQEFLYTMEVLYYLNPDIEWELFLEAALWVSDRSNGKIVRTYGTARVKEGLAKIWENPRKPYVNQYRRVVFNPSRRISKEDKLSTVGRLCGGRKKATTEQEIYDVMEEFMAEDVKITINVLAEKMNVTRQTISKHMTKDMKELMKDYNEGFL